MFTICILFITVTTKTKGMREGALEQSSDLKNYTAPGPCPPVLKFLDPPLLLQRVLFCAPLLPSIEAFPLFSFLEGSIAALV